MAVVSSAMIRTARSIRRLVLRAQQRTLISLKLAQ